MDLQLPRNGCVKISKNAQTLSLIPCDKMKYVGKIIFSMCAVDRLFIEQIIGLFPNVKELEIGGCVIFIRRHSISSKYLCHYHFSPDFFDSELFDNIDLISVTELINDGLMETNKFYKKIIQNPDQGCGFEQYSFCTCTHCAKCTNYFCCYHYPLVYGIQGPQGLGESTRYTMNVNVSHDSDSHSCKSYGSHRDTDSKIRDRSYGSDKGTRNPKVRNRWTKHRR